MEKLFENLILASESDTEDENVNEIMEFRPEDLFIGLIGRYIEAVILDEYKTIKLFKVAYKKIIDGLDMLEHEEKCDEEKDKAAVEIIETIIKKVKEEHKCVLKITPDVLKWCFLIYYRSPRIYEYFSLNYKELPNGNAMDDLLLKFRYDTGIHPTILEVGILKIMDFTKKEKYCILSFHHMAISDNENDLSYDPVLKKTVGLEDYGHLKAKETQATQALVFMVLGMDLSWKQVLSYYFVSEKTPSHVVKNLIVYNIEKLQEMGLKVIATVSSDEESNRIPLEQLTKESVTVVSDFHFEVNNQRIFIIYDVADLLKSLRNVFEKHDIIYDNDKKATYKYVNKGMRDHEEKFSNEFERSKFTVAAFQFSCIMAWKLIDTDGDDANPTAKFLIGIHPTILEVGILKIMDFTKKEKYCILSFHHMAISDNENDLSYDPVLKKTVGLEDYGHLKAKETQATQALVFMVLGMDLSWKQVLSYYFVSEKTPSHVVKNLIVYNIEKLQEMGLKVIATVSSDEESNRIPLEQLTKESVTVVSDFHFEVNNQRIFIIYDVADLLKSLRNVFEKHDIIYDNDKKATYKYVNKGMRDHEEKFSNEFERSKFTVAAFQFSCIMAWKLIDTDGDDANPTAKFLIGIDFFIHALTCKLNQKNFKSAVFCLSEMHEQMNTWKFYDSASGKEVTNEIHPAKSWQTTIKSVLHLWYHIVPKVGFTSLKLYNFKIDALENLFAVIRGKPGVVPTGQQFVERLKVSVLDRLKMDSNIESCCEPDGCASLCSLSFLLPEFEPEELAFHANDLHEHMAEMPSNRVP